MFKDDSCRSSQDERQHSYSLPWKSRFFPHVDTFMNSALKIRGAAGYEMLSKQIRYRLNSGKKNGDGSPTCVGEALKVVFCWRYHCLLPSSSCSECNSRLYKWQSRTYCLDFKNIHAHNSSAGPVELFHELKTRWLIRRGFKLSDHPSAGRKRNRVRLQLPFCLPSFSKRILLIMEETPSHSQTICICEGL